LFAGQALGWETHGIELLPVGIFVMETREALRKINPAELNKSIRDLWQNLNKIENSSTISGRNNFLLHFSGIDPAGADEHWKTANFALERIRKSFAKKKKPQTFFIGASIAIGIT
jgi:hypothetical protein